MGITAVVLFRYSGSLCLLPDTHINTNTHTNRERAHLKDPDTTRWATDPTASLMMKRKKHFSQHTHTVLVLFFLPFLSRSLLDCDRIHGQHLRDVCRKNFSLVWLSIKSCRALRSDPGNQSLFHLKIIFRVQCYYYRPAARNHTHSTGVGSLQWAQPCG